MKLRPVYQTENPSKFANWVRDLKFRTGVYAVFVFDVCVYVGSSQSDLYGTITRHFQNWNRLSGGPRPGVVFNRKDVLVGVELVPAQQARQREQDWIDEYEPTENSVDAFTGPAAVRKTEAPGILDEIEAEFDDFIPF